MKKIFFGMMAMVAMVATSCQQDVDLGVQAGETTSVAFNLATPQIATKAKFSEGTLATHLQYAVYQADGTILPTFTVTDGVINGSTTVEFQLTTGNTYYVLFWAAHPDAPYTVDLTNKTMEVSYNNAVSSDENRDAFYYYDDFIVKAGMDPITAELKRPFAQLNIGTNDLTASANAGYAVTQAKVTVPVYTTLDFVSGNASNQQVVTFDYTNIPTSYEFPVAGYEYLAMNYLLMNTTKETVDVKFQYTDGTTAQAERTVGSVPVQRNHRTNLYGQLLTTNSKVNVEIKPEYAGTHEAEALQMAATFGGEVTLTEDVVLEQGLNVTADMTINLNGHNITIAAAYNDANATASSAISNNAIMTLTGNGEIKAENNYTVRNYGTMIIDGVTVKNGIMNFGELTVESGNISNSRSGKHTIYGDAAKLTINGGTFHNENAGNAAIFAYGGEVVINGGEFTIADGTSTIGWTSCLLDAQGGAKYTINGGVVRGVVRDYGKNTTIYGGTFSDYNSIKDFIAEGYAVVENNGAYTVIPTTLKDGGVLDLGGAEYDGTIIVEGNVTIKGDAKITTVKSTTGCTITIEDGKTLTLNNFIFGDKVNADAVYEIKGGTVTANYGFFQHGKYELYSNFETGYMYYSYGSDITVYGTFHSQGKGDGLDYVRGKLTIANGGKSIHDKSLWVGQPAEWGAMNASLVIEEGGYVQANSLSVYAGSTLTYSNDADLKYNSVTGTEYIIKK